MAAPLSQARAAERVALPEMAVRRTPSILQLEAVECGAAALAMVLAFHGKHVPLERLRVECGVSRDGSKAGNILRAARAHGLASKGFRKEPRELASLPTPSILFWNFNHFVVLEGFRKGQARINDPALGRRNIDAEEFDSAFTGVVLTFEPGPDFVPGGDAPSVRRSLAQYLAGLKPALGFAVFLGFALVLPGLLLPWLMGRFIDDVLVARMGSLAFPLLLGLAGAALVRTALVWVQGQLLTDTYGAAAQNASARFMGHALSLPMSFYAQRSPGELSARVDLNGRVAETVTSDLPQLALDLFTASFFLVLMVRLEPGLAVVAVAGLLLELAVWRVLAARTAEISQQLSMRGGKLAGTITGGLANIEGIKAAGQEQALFTKWMGLQVQYVNAVAGAQRLALTLGQAPGLLSLIAHLAVLGLGAVRIVEGSFTVGNLVAFQLLLAGFVSPVHALFAATQQLQSLRGDLARLDDVLHYGKEASVSMETQARGERTAHLSLEFREVTFGYDRNGPALIENISFTLAPGKRVALVGASGSGKSTVGRLAAGLYAPWSGEILFNGKPREAWSRDALAQALSYVDQDVILFQGTVRENLTLWDATIDDARILAALDDAAIRDEILSRVQGTDNPLDASLAEGARNLSGGQRQRLEIARALARSPAMLVLDEATSALDFAAEARIEAALRKRGIASLVVAHRLSTVRDADEILVIDAGRVVERGTHASLSAIEGGRYRALVAAESREEAS